MSHGPALFSDPSESDQSATEESDYEDVRNSAAPYQISSPTETLISISSPTETLISEPMDLDFNLDDKNGPNENSQPVTHGLPLNDVYYDEDKSLVKQITDTFRPHDIDLIVHCVVENPMGQTAITRKIKFDNPRWTPECRTAFKTGKGLLEAIDKFAGLSVDYECLDVPIELILSNMPERYEEKARAHWENDPVSVHVRPLDKVIECMLSDSTLKDVFKYCYMQQIDAMGNRIYDEAYSSDYCKTLQEKIPDGGTPLLLKFGSDAALATKIGKQSFHPMIMTFGNIDKRWRNKLSNQASVMVAYLPVLSNQTTGERESQFLTAYKRAVHHATLAIILSCIEDWVTHGVDLISPDGRMRCYYPCLFNYDGDYPELTLTATVSPGCLAAPMPCCFVKQCELSNCGRSCQSFVRKKTESLEQNFKFAMRGKSYTIQRARFAAKGQVPFVKNAFYKLHMASERFCIHSAVTADPMHSIFIGVFGYHLWKLVKSAITEKLGDKGLQKMDLRISKIPPYPGFSRFQKGASSLSKLTKKDYASIMIYLLPCVYDLVSVEVIECLEALFDITMMVSAKSHTDSSLAILTARLQDFSDLVQVFDTDKKSMNFPKMHILASFPEAIRRFGATDSYGTEFLESTQRTNVVAAYADTNRKESEKQMIQNVTRKDKVNRMRNLMLRHKGLTSGEAKMFTWSESADPHFSLVARKRLFSFREFEASDKVYHGLSHKVGKYGIKIHLFVKEHTLFRSAKIVNFDKNSSQHVEFLRIGNKGLPDFCVYMLNKLKPPVMESGLGGSQFLVGRAKHFMAVKHQDSNNISHFVVLQRYQALPQHQQNKSGLFILEPAHVGDKNSIVVAPLNSIKGRAHIIPYFQDGQNGKSGKVYLNTYAERNLWSIIRKSYNFSAGSDTESILSD
ncbi:hypothetical protein HDU79_007416 [Rhizoclosmatium sp. JEL0117]|nr:hypothetical protein HDU79_007416 [Rhizoclosmatium sp. JEL0117]